MTTALITGGTGFLGSHLAEHLAGQGVYVTVTTRRSRGYTTAGIKEVVCDVCSAPHMASVVRECRPDLLVHMASQSLLAASWEQPQRTLEVNVLGTLHMLEAARMLEYRPTMILAGTSAEYGPGNGSPITESAPLDPSSPYGVSKAAALMLTRSYAALYGMRLIWVRPFLVVGPRKFPDACSQFARGIVAIERGAAFDLPVGNVEPVRDFLDVRDAVRALWLLSKHPSDNGACEVFNICSGVGRRIGDVLEEFIRLAHASVTVRPDPARFRPVDHPVVVGDNSRLRALGWTPEIPIRETVKSILEFWRSAQ